MSSRRVTASNIVKAIRNLPKNRAFDYPSNAKTQISVWKVDGSEGPVRIKRWGTKKHPTEAKAEIQTISPAMIWRVANALRDGVPISIDRVLGASYNTRSALEALLLHSPEYYICRPGRLQTTGDKTEIKFGHKHMIWLPNNPHDNGKIVSHDTSMVISEVNADSVHEAISSSQEGPKLDRAKAINTDRIHAQMQITLFEIGVGLGFRTWLAGNDQWLRYKGKSILDFEDVINDLAAEKLLLAYPEAVRAGRLIDLIWFKNGRFMPAVIEVENSTGIQSGLDRMVEFYEQAPPLSDVYWIIAAPDSDKPKFNKFASRAQYSVLKPKFLSYSAIEELFYLLQRRSFTGITPEFLENFFEVPEMV